MEECRAGLVRLFGDEAVRKDAKRRFLSHTTTAMPADAYRLNGSAARVDVEAADDRGLLYACTRAQTAGHG
jgi:hypothetical protein